MGPKATKFSEIIQNKGQYAVQDHSRSPILVPVKSPHATTYKWLILTYLLSCTVSELRPISGQIFASDRGGANHFSLTPSLEGDPCEYADKLLPLQKLEWMSYLILMTARSYLHSSGHNTGTWRTDRQFCSGYYSGLYCEQCAMRTRCNEMLCHVLWFITHREDHPKVEERRHGRSLKQNGIASNSPCEASHEKLDRRTTSPRGDFSFPLFSLCSLFLSLSFLCFSFTGACSLPNDPILQISSCNKIGNGHPAAN